MSLIPSLMFVGIHAGYAKIAGRILHLPGIKWWTALLFGSSNFLIAIAAQGFAYLTNGDTFVAMLIRFMALCVSLGLGTWLFGMLCKDTVGQRIRWRKGLLLTATTYGLLIGTGIILLTAVFLFGPAQQPL